MLETNHVRAALLKSLPLFLINTQIIYRSKCNRKTHTHLLAGQSMCWDNGEKKHAALPKPTPTNKQTWKGEAKHVL